MDSNNGTTIKDFKEETGLRDKVITHLAYAKATDLHIYRELVYETE